MTSRISMYDLKKYEQMDDKDIVEVARNGDSLAIDYLLNKYKNFVISKSAQYYLVGGERDDIIQEGMIGLFKAIRDYDGEKLTPFLCFVEMCIKRQMISAVRTATRKKHQPLNSYISLNKNVYIDESDRILIDTIEENKVSDPMEVYINREDFEKVKNKIDHILSKLENKVFKYYLEGKTYDEISSAINKDFKCIDNAIQRAKKKCNERIKK